MEAPAHLLHTSDGEVGYTRKRNGKNFTYYNEQNKKITNKLILGRLSNLGIPPAWENVWICKEDNGYLQALGYDERKRKQYIYHPDWALYRNLDKFQNLYKFGEDLSKIRLQIWQDIRLTNWPKEKVVALAIAILDETYVRVGNKIYTETNNTYGLTTLRRKHMETHTNKVKFSYIAKGGKQLNVTLNNKKLCKLIKACAELPGYQIFNYLDESKNSISITSLDINNYLKALTGEQYTAKNFRTWGGTVSALEHLEQATEYLKENPKLNIVNIIVKTVSKILNNTIPICRKYYIHPAILSAIEQNIANKFLAKANRTKRFPELDLYEKQMMLILEDYYK